MPAFAAAFVATALAAPPAASARPAPPAQAAVLNGQPGTLAEFPFIVALVFRGAELPEGHTCGATRIAPRVLVTAAHCVYDLRGEKLDVVAGLEDLSADGGVRVPVVKINVHPRYSALTRSPDVAVLRTGGDLPGAPVALASSGDQLGFPGDGVRVAGWGLLREQPDLPSEILRRADLKVRPDDECGQGWGLLFDSVTMLCTSAADPANPADACRGDSGGPLVSNSDPVRLVGIVSFGQRCGDNSHPTVYTQVSSVRRFIDAQVRDAARGGSRSGITLACKRRVCRIRVRIPRARARVARVRVVVGVHHLRARRLEGRMWQAVATIPRGRVKLKAYAFTASGKPAVSPMMRTVRVGDDGRVTE